MSGFQRHPGVVGTRDAYDELRAASRPVTIRENQMGATPTRPPEPATLTTYSRLLHERVANMNRMVDRAKSLADHIAGAEPEAVKDLDESDNVSSMLEDFGCAMQRLVIAESMLDYQLTRLQRSVLSSE